MLSNLPAGVREGVAKVLADYADDPPLYRVVTAFVHAARAGAIPDFARVGERVSIPDVVPALRYGRDAVLKALPADLRGASDPRLQRLIEATRSVRVALLSVPFDEVWCRKPKCAEPHMLPGPWMEAIKNHDDALADVLTLFPFADTGTDAGGGGGSAAPDIHRVKLSPSVDAGDASRAFGAALARFGSGLRDLIAENPPDLEARLAADAEGLPNEVAVGYWQVARAVQAAPPSPAENGEPERRTQVPMLTDLKVHDRQAWQLATLHGMTQGKVADRLNKEHGTTYTQGQVSRMIRRAKAHADASGLTEIVAGPINRPRTVDPGRLELGARVDKRKPRPSDMAGADDDRE